MTFMPPRASIQVTGPTDKRHLSLYLHQEDGFCKAGAALVEKYKAAHALDARAPFEHNVPAAAPRSA